MIDLLVFAIAALLPTAATAQRERESLGIAAERDGGEKKLGDGVHFGGEVRQRLEVQDNTPLGPEPRRGDAIVYYRLLGAADMRASRFRAYVQAGTRVENGLNGPPIPIATNRFDVQQAFVDANLGSAERRLRLRGGRQEVSFEFVAVRDSPNVRRTWDGGRATVLAGGWEVDAFALERVIPKVGVMDDTSSGSDRLTGLHVISPSDEAHPAYFSGYFYDVDQPMAEGFPSPVASSTRTLGGSIDGRKGALLYRLGGGAQWGRRGTRPVDAHAYEAVIGVAFARSAWKPTVSLRTEGFSGGSAASRVARTWNPLFPNYAYSTEVAFQAPSNLRKGGVVATAERGKLELQYRGEGLWRFSARDAFYVPDGLDPVAPDGTNDRWIGWQQHLRATWKPTEAITVLAAYVNFQAGSFLRRAGRTGQNFGALSVEYRF